MNSNNINYTINPADNSTLLKARISDNNVSYKRNSTIHENYWFQDINNTILNYDLLLKIFPDTSMTYPEKINAIVRLMWMTGIILGLFYANYLFLYIPIITMILTYILYIFRLDQLENTRAQQGPNSTLNDITKEQINNLKKKI